MCNMERGIEVRLSKVDFFKKVYNRPEGYSQPLSNRIELREALVQQLCADWFLPEEKHYTAYCEVYRILYSRYSRLDHVTRLKIFRNTKEWLNSHKLKNWAPVPVFKVPISTISLFGSPGMGKSHFWDHVLGKCFPQVLKQDHTIQVTYMVLNCSAFNSLKAFCLFFFAELDNILISYYHTQNLQYVDPYAIEFSKNNYTAEKMLPFMANVAAQHDLGVLIIDEVNHLTEGNKNMAEITMFFKNLTRAIGLPIIFSGTPNAIEKLGFNLQSIRRLVGVGMINWKFYTSDSKNWHRFIQHLWNFQVTNDKVEITDQITDLYYQLTGGVMDFAIKLFVRCQIEALQSNRIVDTEFINEIREKWFYKWKSVITAIHSSDYFLKSNYNDIDEGFPSLLQNTVNQSSFGRVQRELSHLNLSQEQASLLIEILRSQYPKLTDTELQESIKNQIDNTHSQENKELNKRRSINRSKRSNSNSKDAILTELQGMEIKEIKSELENRGYSGPLDYLIK